MDFHNPDFVHDIWHKLDAHAYVKTLKDASMNSLVTFAKCHDLVLEIAASAVDEIKQIMLQPEGIALTWETLTAHVSVKLPEIRLQHRRDQVIPTVAGSIIRWYS